MHNNIMMIPSNRHNRLQPKRRLGHQSFPRVLMPSLILCFLFVNSTNAQDSLNLKLGHPSCPCLTSRQELPTIDARDQTDTLESTVGYRANKTSYGMACSTHDQNTPQCSDDANSDCAVRRNFVPPPLGCDLSWCERKWCFVDPGNCTLSHRRHPSFTSSDRYYSYATCGDMDAFTNNRRFAALEGNVFKIGLNANTGGWLGSYRPDGVHFEGPVSKWSGMALDYVIKAAYRGNFLLELQEPPDFLRERSETFFNSKSDFDLCVYATSLGYLDMCVAQYTITDQRASSTDWLLLGSSGIYLVIDTSDASISSVEYFFKSVTTIFQPFTPEAWAFIVFFVIPVLGCLMIVHERGKGGSTYPTEEAVVVIDETKGVSVLKKRPIPLRRTLIKSIYIAFLAVLQQSYEQSVLTLGAMLNLLGISFFILTIIAVYTANLAAILTQNVQASSIDSFEDAVRAGYRFCSERKNMESIMNVYPNLDPNIFVVDPMSMGGDGKPGFSCSDCSSRVRVFDFMDPLLADTGDSRYCHATIAPIEDLDVMHAASMHCNKTTIGAPVHMVQTGMPIFETVSPQLISFFLKLKNDGLYDTTVAANKPESQCPIHTNGGTEGSALGLAQLSGIWVVSFAFAAAGLVATGIQKWNSERLSKRQYRVKQVHKRDQKGGRIDALGIEDSWMTAASRSTTCITPNGNSRPGIIHEGSKAGSIRLMEASSNSNLSEQRNLINHKMDPNDNHRSSRDMMQLERKPSSRPRPMRTIFQRSSSNSNHSASVTEPEPTPETSSTSSENDAFQSIASARESRERLLQFIDQQVTLQEGTTQPSKEDQRSVGEGSLDLQCALDELAFSSSFGNDDSQV